MAFTLFYPEELCMNEFDAEEGYNPVLYWSRIYLAEDEEEYYDVDMYIDEDDFHLISLPSFFLAQQTEYLFEISMFSYWWPDQHQYTHLLNYTTLVSPIAVSLIGCNKT